MQALLDLLNHQMQRPEMYQGIQTSWFQYLSLIIMIFLMVIFVKKYKQATRQDVISFIGIMAWILIGFEILKQINFTDANGGTYQWYAFPFQFCSTPMYIGLLLRYTKNQTLQSYLMMFLATYGFFAGFAVMLYPADVYTSTTLINIQTMVHHGGMAVMGIVLLSYHVEKTFKAFTQGVIVFSILTGIAILLNFIHNTWIGEGTFNMFFINRLYQSGIPILSLFQPLVPNSLYILIFISGFSLVGYIMLLGSKVFTYRQQNSHLIKKPA